MKLYFFMISILVSCQRLKLNRTIDGLWIQEGYGRIITIKDSTYTYFNTSKNSCIPLISNGKLTDRFRIVEFKNDKLVLNPGGIVDYYFTRLEKLPEYCINNARKIDHSPELNFSVLWHTFDKHYAFFKSRNIDWNIVKKESYKKLKNIQSDKQLYNLFTDILKQFNDGHINLDVPDSLKIKHIVNTKIDSIKSKNEIITNISSTYLNCFNSYNNGVIQWGILKNENIGYLVVTDMNNFSNYVPNQDISAKNFDKEYEKILKTKSGITQLDDELKGVHFAMNKILSDLETTHSIIIDLRFNGGGYDTIALEILSYFVKSQKHILSIKAKKGTKYTDKQDYILSPATNTYQGTITVLTSHNTASAAEIFTLGTLAHPEIKRFGSSTNGIFSEILWKNLPNGWEFSLSNEVYSDPKGNIYEGKGVPPNYKIDYPKNGTEFYNSFYKGKEFKDIGIEKIIKWQKQRSN
ncbi:MAG: S41 family peptidase [Flavobacteriaceae bacterium]|nr:S41 family peptidase [Flavobacteriaceae bacterium]